MKVLVRWLIGWPEYGAGHPGALSVDHWLQRRAGRAAGIQGALT
jgi:hypothetical protein